MKKNPLKLVTIMLLLLCVTLTPVIVLGVPPAEEIKLFVKIEGVDGGSTYPGYGKWIEAVTYGDSLFKKAN